MTGLFPHSHGITSNVHNLGSSVHELADGHSLLPRQLESAGYKCGYTGKWHLGTDKNEAFGASNNPSLPRDVGFQGHNFPGHGGGGHRYAEYRNYLETNGLEHDVLPWKHSTPRFFVAGEEHCATEATVPYFLANNTIDLMRQFAAEESPFFIWHSFWGPHGPYYAPTEFVDLYRNVPIPEWPNYRWPARSIPGPHQCKLLPFGEELEWEAWETMVRYYYAFTTLIDSQIGRMIEELRELGELENTLIIFTADHGETIGSHGGLTDKGWHHFEETHRVPLIVRSNEQIEPGLRIDELVSLADLYPTILDSAGIDISSLELHGRPLAPLMRGEETDWRDAVVTEFGGVNNLATTMRTMRCGDLKYGFNCGLRDELYDLRTDPDETSNLVDNPGYRRRADEMRRLLLDWMTETKDPARGRAVELFSHYLTDLRVYQRGDSLS